MSLWEMKRTNFYSKLEENKIVDTLIIGGGMSGVQTLYQMRDQNVCLVEAEEIGAGVSQNTTAKINYLQDNTLFSLWKEGHQELAISYLASQLAGMKLLLDIIEKEDISCDLEEVPSFLVANDLNYVSKLKNFKKFLEHHSIQVTEDISLIQESFSYGIGVFDTFVFHPLKFLLGIVSKLQVPIYEHTKIVKIVRGEEFYFCHTLDGHCIRAKHVVVACHYSFFLKPFFLPMKSSVEKSYLVAIPVKKNLKYTYISVDKPLRSVRFYQDGKQSYQICLGASHDISIQQNDKKNFEEVLQLFQKKEKDVAFFWSNVDVKTKDHLAYIGEVAPNLFLSTGYQTWGMITSSLSANIISDAIYGEENEFAFLFRPKRMSLAMLEQCFSSLFVNSFSFIRSKYYPKSWYSKDLSFSFQNGKLIATYVDELGEHSVHPVCPHLKCGLIFNQLEKTWDCPCHSSRFDKDGNWLKGPAKESISENLKTKD